MEKKKQFHNSEHSYVKSFVFLTFKSKELCGIFCNSWTASATQMSDTKDQVVLCSRMSILKLNSLYKVLVVLKTNRDEKLSLWFCLKCTVFFLATFNIFGYLLAFDGREDPKVLQWLCKSLHSLWFQDLIKKLLVIDRTKRIGNLKVFFISIGNQKVLKYISSFCVCNVQLKDLNVGSLPFSCLINDNFKSFVETFRFIARLAILSYLNMFCNHKRNNIHIYCLHRLEQRMWRGTNGSRESTGRTSITGL